ncbi:MAG: type I polyketide synthase, partial [bacterium]|nr:type I polyketide synthase [bacterium]
MSPADELGEEPTGIAIIGLAGRFPGSPDLEAFWRNLRDGVEGISFFSTAELTASGIAPELAADPAYVPARGIVDDVDLFDAEFFDFSPREAEITDPQHRLILECAWEALENAGYDPARSAGLIGTFAGIGVNRYAQAQLFSASFNFSVHDLELHLANDKDHLATRVAYKLDLRGPALTVQTACSSSLVAVHLACQSLLCGECDMALAGGVWIAVPQRCGYLWAPESIMSPDGRCRAFDAGACGTVSGNGLGIVVLKRLGEALADGDRVRAVVKGSAINNDGAARVGYTAPGLGGQAAVIREAQAVAGVDPATITYVEAHGTGTALGDPIEVAALARAFGPSAKRASCAIGSVKTNVGHLGVAAGVTGLIKTVLAIEHGEIPPSLHFHEPNPEIDFAATPFFVNTQLRPWPRGDTPRRAGVSSFGMGGTNAHVVIEEAPAVPAPVSSARPEHLLVLSARTATALAASTVRLRDHLAAHPDPELADAAFTLQVGRQAFEHRRAVVCRDVDDAIDVLGGGQPERLLTRRADPGERLPA